MVGYLFFIGGVDCGACVLLSISVQSVSWLASDVDDVWIQRMKAVMYVVSVMSGVLCRCSG